MIIEWLTKLMKAERQNEWIRERECINDNTVRQSNDNRMIEYINDVRMTKWLKNDNDRMNGSKL